MNSDPSDESSSYGSGSDTRSRSSVRTDESSHDSDHSDRITMRDEKRAKYIDTAVQQAAACGGMFVNVEYPWIRTALFTDYGLATIYQKESPFFFKAWTKESSHGTEEPKRVFLKVWKVGEVDKDQVQSEWANHRVAFNAGVPVAAPVCDELVRSKTSSGSVYLVFAVERLYNDIAKDDKGLLQFSRLLIEAVKKLHEDAGLLHCDLKPGNICWSAGVVKLIDFGHSQKISNAEWSRGTEGFEAPEIVNSTVPCSTKTDAFSVGAIILDAFKYLNEESQKSQPSCALHDIATKLTDSDPDTRWSLSQALLQIRQIQTT